MIYLLSADMGYTVTDESFCFL